MQRYKNSLQQRELHWTFLLQVTYRVVQVTEDHLEAAGDGGAAVSVVSTATFAGAQQAVAQVCMEQTRRKYRGIKANASDLQVSYTTICVSIGCHSEPFQ